MMAMMEDNRMKPFRANLINWIALCGFALLMGLLLVEPTQAVALTPWLVGTLIVAFMPIQLPFFRFVRRR